ncbi:MAG: universal stress protein [Neptuniibacter sp.]
MYKQILVPIDESHFSMQMIEHSIQFASIHSAKISFLYLSPDENNIVTGDAGLLHAMAPDLFAGKYLWQDGYIKAKALGWARTVNQEAVFISDMVSGAVHNAILKKAKEQDADLIIMGSHWRSSLIEKLFGSVTTKVVLHSDIPVLVTPAGPQESSDKTRVIAMFREIHAVWIALFDLLIDELSKEPTTSKVVEKSFDLLEGIAKDLKDVFGLSEFKKLSDLYSPCGATPTIFFDKAYEKLHGALMKWKSIEQEQSQTLISEIVDLRSFVIARVVGENQFLLEIAEENAEMNLWSQIAETMEQDFWSTRRKARQDEIRNLFGELNRFLQNDK